MSETPSSMCLFFFFFTVIFRWQQIGCDHFFIAPGTRDDFFFRLGGCASRISFFLLWCPVSVFNSAEPVHTHEFFTPHRNDARRAETLDRSRARARQGDARHGQHARSLSCAQQISIFFLLLFLLFLFLLLVLLVLLAFCATYVSKYEYQYALLCVPALSLCLEWCTFRFVVGLRCFPRFRMQSSRLGRR